LERLLELEEGREGDDYSQLPPRSSVVAGRPPQPQEKTSVALRKQTEGDGIKVGLLFLREIDRLLFGFFPPIPEFRW